MLGYIWKKYCYQSGHTDRDTAQFNIVIRTVKRFSFSSGFFRELSKALLQGQLVPSWFLILLTEKVFLTKNEKGLNRAKIKSSEKREVEKIFFCAILKVNKHAQVLDSSICNGTILNSHACKWATTKDGTRYRTKCYFACSCRTHGIISVIPR